MPDGPGNELNGAARGEGGMSTSSLEAWFMREVWPLEAILMHYLRQNWRDQSAAEDLLRGEQVTPQHIASVAEAVMNIAQPQSDMRGSAEYKRHAAGALAKLAVEAAWRRARGEDVEVMHLYA